MFVSIISLMNISNLAFNNNSLKSDILISSFFYNLISKFFSFGVKNFVPLTTSLKCYKDINPVFYESPKLNFSFSSLKHLWISS